MKKLRQMILPDALKQRDTMLVDFPPHQRRKMIRAAFPFVTDTGYGEAAKRAGVKP